MALELGGIYRWREFLECYLSGECGAEAGYLTRGLHCIAWHGRQFLLWKEDQKKTKSRIGFEWID